jgi:hypothetical protein
MFELAPDQALHTEALKIILDAKMIEGLKEEGEANVLTACAIRNVCACPDIRSLLTATSCS